jgi:hypothetical protein
VTKDEKKRFKISHGDGDGDGRQFQDHDQAFLKALVKDIVQSGFKLRHSVQYEIKKATRFSVVLLLFLVFEKKTSSNTFFTKLYITQQNS